MTVSITNLTFNPQSDEYVKAEDFQSIVGIINANFTVINNAIADVTGTNIFSGSNTFSSTLSVTTNILHSIESLTGGGAVDPEKLVSLITTTGVEAYTLADPTANISSARLKIIKLITDGGDATLTPTNLAEKDTITFNDAGDSVILVWANSNWNILTSEGCVCL